ncbi:MAG: hypothetical protein ABGY95_11650 [Rubritalea sp.]|uniref:hypothetical protein n=1 Tax=Rubritalea sp. TaxID=2109375 RepID=UPI003241E426
MKTRTFRKKQRSGLVTILSVVVISSFLLVIMGIMYRGAIRALEAQKKVQLQVDYDARKQAFLRSVITLSPVTVANTMITSANADFDGNSGLFDLASSVSKFGSARSAADETGMGFPDSYKNGNTGHISGAFDVADCVTMVTAATAPALLGETVSFSKIDYPDIHFGYYTLDADGKKKFIAKRNSWKVNVHPRAVDVAAAGLSQDLLTDEYTLDLYEIPSQLAISSSAITDIGQIGADNYDVGNANNISIKGNVYAKKASLSHGDIDGVASTQGVSLEGGAIVGGNIGAAEAAVIGARTTHENTTGSYYPISKASDFARSLFIPINPGFSFFDRFATSDLNGDPTEDWYTYSCGSHQCKMKLDIIEVIGGQPTALRFSINNYSVVIRNASSLLGFGIDWPVSGDEDYDDFPFLPESSSGTEGVAIHLEKLALWIQTATGGGISQFNVKDYHSIAVNANYKSAGANVPIAPTPSLSPFVVILRDCSDLTYFTDGFSIVTNYTLHVLEDLNQTPKTLGDDDYPPLSVFAPTIGYGLGDQFRSVSLSGSLGSLNRGTDEIKILELKDTSGGAFAAQTFADLKPIEEIAELPPINVMNWLVMIKKSD